MFLPSGSVKTLFTNCFWSNGGIRTSVGRAAHARVVSISHLCDESKSIDFGA